MFCWTAFKCTYFKIWSTRYWKPENPLVLRQSDDLGKKPLHLACQRPFPCSVHLFNVVGYLPNPRPQRHLIKFNKGSIFRVKSFDVGFGKYRDLGCFDLVLKHLTSKQSFNQTVIDTKIQLHLWQENCFHCFLLNGSKLVVRVTMVLFLSNIILMSTEFSIFTNLKWKELSYTFS